MDAVTVSVIPTYERLPILSRKRGYLGILIGGKEIQMSIEFACVAPEFGWFGLFFFPSSRVTST